MGSRCACRSWTPRCSRNSRPRSHQPRHRRNTIWRRARAACYGRSSSAQRPDSPHRSGNGRERRWALPAGVCVDGPRPCTACSMPMPRAESRPSRPRALPRQRNRMSSQAPSSDAARSLRLPGKAIATALLAFACAMLFFNRDAVLRIAADAWIVSDQPRSADAVVILGGGIETRPLAAAAYYRQGLVKKVLIADAALIFPNTVRAIPSHADLNRAVLVKLGVPNNAIEIFGKALSSTHDEALALREWALHSHARTILVPTELFHTRRVRWIMQRALDGTGTRVDVPALDQREYAANDWWRSEQGLLDFHNEVVKYAYYRLKY